MHIHYTKRKRNRNVPKFKEESNTVTDLTENTDGEECQHREPNEDGGDVAQKEYPEKRDGHC